MWNTILVLVADYGVFWEYPLYFLLCISGCYEEPCRFTWVQPEVYEKLGRFTWVPPEVYKTLQESPAWFTTDVRSLQAFCENLVGSPNRHFGRPWWNPANYETLWDLLQTFMRPCRNPLHGLWQTSGVSKHFVKILLDCPTDILEDPVGVLWTMRPCGTFYRHL